MKPEATELEGCCERFGFKTAPALAPRSAAIVKRAPATRLGGWQNLRSSHLVRAARTAYARRRVHAVRARPVHAFMSLPYVEPISARANGPD